MDINTISKFESSTTAILNQKYYLSDCISISDHHDQLP